MDDALAKGWEGFKEVMNGNLVYTDVVLQKTFGTFALIDEGCQCYAVINEELVKGLGLRYVSSENREIKGASKVMKNGKIKGAVAFRMEIAGFNQNVYAYVVDNLAFPIILGNPWKAANKIRTAPEKRRYYHGVAKQWIAEGRNHLERKDTDDFASVAVATSEDIEMALKEKPELTLEQLKERLPPEIKDMAALFSKRESEKLAPYRSSIDHHIELY